MTPFWFEHWQLQTYASTEIMPNIITVVSFPSITDNITKDE